MIFPDTLEDKLGYDSIRQRLKSYCLSQAGAAWIDRMRFSTDAEFIKILLRQNLEFKQILDSFYMNLPDGMPGVWVGKLKGAKQMRRCYGPDFFKVMMMRVQITFLVGELPVNMQRVFTN